MHKVCIVNFFLLWVNFTRIYLLPALLLAKSSWLPNFREIKRYSRAWMQTTVYPINTFNNNYHILLCSAQFSHSVVSDSLQPHGLQHARLPCPSPTPGVYSNSCPLSWWCHPAISSSVVHFSSCLQSFPALGSFPVLMYGRERWTIRKAEHRRIDVFNCGVGEDSWESHGLQGDPSSPS